MKRIKISLAAVAFVIATTGAFATTALSNAKVANQTKQDAEDCRFPNGRIGSSDECLGTLNNCCLGVTTGHQYKKDN